MSTVEDFENAPVGATATGKATGVRAMKVARVEERWVLPSGLYVDDESMERWGYTLDPLEPAPATVREALDLAWELGHEVKEGQVVPKGTQYLVLHSSGLTEYTAQIDFEITPELASITRTLEPLPETEPDWLDAPAVIATTRWCDTELWLPETGGYYWECSHCDDVRYWRDLTDVTPLYPKEVQEA